MSTPDIRPQLASGLTLAAAPTATAAARPFVRQPLPQAPIASTTADPPTHTVRVLRPDEADDCQREPR